MGKSDTLRFLLSIIEETLKVAVMALAIFSPFIVYWFLLAFSLINSWVAYATFITYFAVIAAISALVEHLRKQKKEKPRQAPKEPK